MPGGLETTRGFRFDVTSIARLSRASDCGLFPNCRRHPRGTLCVYPPDPEFLMRHEISSSEPDTWWLFTPMDLRFRNTVEIWFLVNYKEKIFRYPDMQTGIIWDESGDEANWRR